MTLGWVPTMAGMMLPSVAPALVRRARALRFAAAYAAVWLAAGLVVYAAYRPPGAAAAAALVLAGGAYELTPLKRACRARCRRPASGAAAGLACVGSSLGLLAILAGAGVMSAAWMCAIAGVAAAQKLLPPRGALDAALAVALVALALT